MSVFLDGVAVRYYRGIGEETQYVAPFSKMNFFIGANNSGKSILLNLLASHLRAVADGKVPKTLSGLEEHRGQQSGHFFVALGKNKQDFMGKALDLFQGTADNPSAQLEDQIETIFDKLSHHGQIWVRSVTDHKDWNIVSNVTAEEAENWNVRWHRLWSKLTHSSGGAHKAHWFPETMAHLSVVRVFGTKAGLN